MGKYAATEGCASCAAIGEMCFGCAINWKEQQAEREFRALRRLERVCRSKGKVYRRSWRNVDEVRKILASLDKIRAAKPQLKATQCMSAETKGK